MLTTLSTTVAALAGRSVSVLLALQDVSRPAGSGGGAAPQGGSAGGGGGTGGMLSTFLLPVLMIAFLYFFMIRPANKQRQEQDKMLKSLQKGDRVVTSSGILGTITGIDDQYVTLEISERVRVKFLRESVTRKHDDKAAAAKATDKPAAAADARK